MIISIFGIDVEITFWFVAFIAIVLSLNAPVNLLITIISSIIHEIGHLTMMLITDNKPQKVKFEIVGINIVRNQEINISIKNEILIALGGPIFNGVALLICSVVLCFYNSEMAMTIACINLILMTFNLLPIKRLDGGMALFFVLSQKFTSNISSKIVKVTSVIFIIPIYIWGLYVLVSTKYNISLIIIAIFLTISLFCDNEY